jgi:DNA-binding beta-propeller fold protein YncE
MIGMRRKRIGDWFGGAIAIARACHRSLAALCILVAAVALWSSPAFALSQRGHVFGFSFGKAGSGPGEISAPSGVAVNESTGDVYIVDRANQRVERFEKCASAVAAGERCKFVSEFSLKSGADTLTPDHIAVDNSGGPSAGDVYVSATAKAAKAETEAQGEIFKFNAEGTELSTLKGAKEPGGTLEKFAEIHGLAVDATGLLWVYQGSEGAVDRFTGEVVNKFLPPALVASLEGEYRDGFAVGSNDELYAGHEPAAALAEEPEEGEEGVRPCEVAPCVIAKLAFNQSTGVELIAPELDAENTSAVAVDLFGAGVFRDDAYLTVGGLANSITGVASFTPAGAPIQRFGAKEGAFEGLKDASAVSVNSKTGDVYVTDAITNTVDVFVLEPPTAPRVDSVSVADVSSTAAELRAQIDPAGAETAYAFEFSTASPVGCVRGASPPCEAPIPAGNVGQGFGDQPASAHVTGLVPGTTYHYRVVAKSSLGGTVSEEQSFTTPSSGGALVLPDGRQWEMVSPPNKQGASIEPIRTEGGSIQAAAAGDAIAYVANSPIVAEPQGNRSPEITQVLSTRGPDGWSSQDIATPDETSQGPSADLPNEYRVFSSDLSLAIVYPYPGNLGSTPTAEPALSPPAAPGEAREKTIYLRANGPSPPLSPDASNVATYEAAQKNGEAMNNAGFLPLVSSLNDTAKNPFGRLLQFLGATADLSHDVIESRVPLTPLPSSAPHLEDYLYEWSAGQLRLVSVLPGAEGTPAAGPFLGGAPEGLDVRHAISNDGSRVFWGTPGALYMRDTVKGETVRLDEAQGGTEHGRETSAPIFQAASADGSRVFFTDTKRLTPASGGEDEKPDLYVCEFPGTAGKCKLTDLTPEVAPGKSAHVLGSVIGSGEDEGGSTLYYVANGTLSGDEENARKETATPGACRVAASPAVPARGSTCNLYVQHSHGEPGSGAWGAPRFIARLSHADVPEWEAFVQSFNRLTSRVSPNGRFLAFMSERSLTGYDNRDANTGQADEEVYRYDASSATLVCASCNPTGARPTGVLDTPESGEGKGLLVDRPGSFSIVEGTNPEAVDHMLAGSVPGWTPMDVSRSLYQSRYLADNGRLFFNSADALVPQDTNGKEDVYEYEASGELGCTSSSATFSAESDGCVALISAGSSTKESAFLDASESGGDAFFLTAAKLAPQDFDTSFDAYDAHECTAQAPCLSPPQPPPPPCSSEACRQAPPSPPSYGAPASATLSGAGNLLAPAQQTVAGVTVTHRLTRAQLLHRALKACHKLRSKKKRATCEKRARRKYGTRKSTTKKRSSHKAGR